MRDVTIRRAKSANRIAQGALILGAGVALVAALGREPSSAKALRRCEAERHDAMARAERLRANLHQRIRTLLASIRSLTARTAERSADLDDFRAHFDGRLAAVARTHTMLARRGGDQVDLEELVREEMLSHAACTEDNCEIDGEHAALNERGAEAVAMAVHELAANAVKYGALSVPDGKITVSWRIARMKSGTRLKLDWIESGVPALIAHPPESGFGRHLIEETLPREMNAKTSLEFAPGGIRCRIELPLEPAASTSGEYAESGSG